MVSDALAEAVQEIDRYLFELRPAYDRELRAKIIALRDQMDALRRELDTPPESAEAVEE